MGPYFLETQYYCHNNAYRLTDRSKKRSQAIRKFVSGLNPVYKKMVLQLFIHFLELPVSVDKPVCDQYGLDRSQQRAQAAYIHLKISCSYKDINKLEISSLNK